MPSAAIRSFKYHPETSRLVIVFQTGRRYAYYDVPPDVHESMRAARSRGTFFNERIRDRYSYSRLEDADGGSGADMSGTRSVGGRLMTWLRPMRWSQD
ncbi:MAG TPA: KTSC domain-containing protein [Steroidobacteraceae bacterium]|nr:KTSC domain-containing protein [Steroidobacteraceae bacterium]